MRIIADTNVLVRCVVHDDKHQAAIAAKILKDAAVIAIPVPTLCEFVWVLRKVYGVADGDIAAAIRTLINTRNAELNRPAVEAGLALLTAGGDFADGVIAHEGIWLGGETFVSFDKKAVSLLTSQGKSAIDLLARRRTTQQE